MRQLRDAVGRLHPERVDQALAVLLILELEFELWLAGQPSFETPHQRLQAAAAILYVAPVAVRRRWPAGALVWLGAVAVAQAALGGYLIDAAVGTVVPPALLGYGAGAWLELRRSLTALVAGVGLLGAAVLVSDVIAPPPLHGAFATDLLVVTLLVAGPWLAGRLARERSRQGAAFRKLAAQASAEREQRAQAAIAEERLRIGRELQDIIIHSVSVMVIQAGGARRLLHDQSGRARESILIIEQTGRDALADLRRLLGMLRKDQDPRALAPQPGLAQLAALVGTLRVEGLECELTMTGDAIDLTPGVDLVAYRVIEAALRLVAANHGRTAAVTVHHDPSRVDLAVYSRATVPDAERALTGVSDRVSLYHGSLSLLDGSGFALEARLPLGAGVLA